MGGGTSTSSGLGGKVSRGTVIFYCLTAWNGVEVGFVDYSRSLRISEVGVYTYSLWVLIRIFILSVIFYDRFSRERHEGQAVAGKNF